jgi:hypothetical protein
VTEPAATGSFDASRVMESGMLPVTETAKSPDSRQSLPEPIHSKGGQGTCGALLHISAK